MAIAEQRDGEIRKISYELVSEGRRLADALGQSLTAVLMGSNIKAKASVLGSYGADRVMVADDPRLEKYTTDAYVTVSAQVIKAADPAIVLLGASVQGKDLAARRWGGVGVGLGQGWPPMNKEGGNRVGLRASFGREA
jgi:electron transfer flavoprotein alpha subunit